MASSSISDRWYRRDGQESTRHGTGRRWLARYRPSKGADEITQSFDKKSQARDWLDEQTSKIVTGTHVHPRHDKTTVGEWCDLWLEGYGTRRVSTVRQARTHLALIRDEFGSLPLGAVRASHVKSWCTKLKAAGYADSTVYALHSRLSQIYTDAIEDNLVARNPCSRRTSPGSGKQKAYVATTEQVWALYDAMPDNLRSAILLGAFVGLRVSEVCGLRVRDVDFMRGIVHPEVQHPAEPLKTEVSKTPIPIPRSLALQFAAHVQTLPESAEHLILNQWGDQCHPRVLERAIRNVRTAHADPLPKRHRDDCPGCLIPDLPAEFIFHDLRHYYASLLIASGADVKVVQQRVRHASAKTTLDVYGHLWPDTDESTRAAIDEVMTARVGDALADSGAILAD